MEYKELCRKPSFYIVAISLLLVSLTSLYCIAPPHFTDIGFDSSFVALTLSVSSAGLIFSKILMGIIYDKFGIRTAVNTCFFADLASKLILFIVTATTAGKFLAIAQCVLKAIAMPIETVMISIIVLDLFGKKSFTKALVINSALFTIGNALNQPLLNLAFDISGEYTISFIVSSVASALVLILMNYAITSLKKGAKEDIASVKR